MSLVARAASPADAGAMARIYNQGLEDRNATFATRPLEAAELTAWFAAGTPIVVVEEAARVVAFAAASPWRQAEIFRGIVELSVYVAREERGRGAGRLALAALIDAARARGLRKLFAGVFSENAPSLALFRRAGFREVGVYRKQAQLEGRWRDVALFELLLE